MEKEINHLLKLITDGTKVMADGNLKAYGLTLSQARLLHTLERANGELLQKQLEEQLQVSHPTVVGILARLEKNGFIECAFDKTYGKNKIVRLTEKAGLFLRDMKNSFNDWDNRIFKGLSDEELSFLKALLEKIYQNLKNN